MAATSLFVYGTLRHNQPAHRRFLRGVTGWQPARLRGRLLRIPAGYLLATAPPASVLMAASADAERDETRLRGLGTEAIAAAFMAMAGEPWRWIEGELIFLRDAARAWPLLDAWEDIAPGIPGLYPRCVVPVQVEEPDGPRIVPAWSYAATTAPSGAVEVAPQA